MREIWIVPSKAYGNNRVFHDKVQAYTYYYTHQCDCRKPQRKRL